MVKTKQKKSDSDKVKKCYRILGYHKYRGRVMGRKKFNSQKLAHDYWNKIKSMGKVDCYIFYIVIKA